ncbi:fatty acid desaturase [Candidatus Poseidoniales archaeon]|nr:fatty acid desaturase [Candidatus Poseidoniales archaeon]MDB2333520.1 fatty acid desaturase [Candidatus Poseidoniales archaeon]MDB2367834.1 fatty acid desaturase [Candidatus Poseidoniales archaeon]
MSKWAPHLVGLATPLSAIICLMIGGWWMLLPIILLLGIYPILDTLGGSTTVHDVEEEGIGHDFIVHLHGIFVPLVVLALLFRIWDGIGSISIIIPILSAGLATGAAGVVAAHELGHRKPKSFSWWLGRLDLLSVVYLHFTVEHNHTHHKHWAREVDPTSSPWGRSIYAHFLRTVPLQLRNAFRIRPKDTSISVVLEIGLLIALAVWGMDYFAAFLGQAIVAIYLLEFVNYIQHHGLLRGEDERPNASHAWESRSRWSKYTLMSLPLHASHHLRSSTPYERLKPHDESPQLPGGYYQMFWISLIPPLFHRLMRKRVNHSGGVGGA